MLFITHQMEVAKQLFSKIALMESGRIAESGSTYEIFSRPKSDLGKALARRSIEHELPPDLLKHEKDLYAVTYKEQSAYDSVIAQVIKKFDCDISILGGAIEYIEGKPLGHLIISIRRHGGRLEEILAFLGERTYIEPIKEGREKDYV